MKWNEILSEKRERDRVTKNSRPDLRSEFEKDYHRIVGSASFRRLQDKTQVFPLDKSDFIRTRLTHSLEVSSYARSLGDQVGAKIIKDGLDPDFCEADRRNITAILSCAGLVHDIGNPPFGHFGEICIRQWFRENLDRIEFKGEKVSSLLSADMLSDFYNFEGNAQALRVLARLHFLIDGYGMNLTYGLLGAILKYPCSSAEAEPSGKDIARKKFGYFCSEKSLFEDVQKTCGLLGRRSPLAFLLEAADDIAYKTADIEDAFTKGFISYDDLMKELCLLEESDENAFKASEVLVRQYNRGLEEDPENAKRYGVLNWTVRMQSILVSEAADSFIRNYEKIMAGEMKQDLFSGTCVEGLMVLLGKMGFEYVFDSDFIYKLELPTSEIYDYLLTKYCHAVLYYDTDEWEKRRTPVDFKLMSIISDNYLRAYHDQARGKSEAERLYLRLLLVTDNICGMTDSYARNFYRDIRGIS